MFGPRVACAQIEWCRESRFDGGVLSITLVELERRKSSPGSTTGPPEVGELRLGYFEGLETRGLLHLAFSPRFIPAAPATGRYVSMSASLEVGSRDRRSGAVSTERCR